MASSRWAVTGGCPSESSRSTIKEPLAPRRVVRRVERALLSMRPLSAPLNFGFHPIPHKIRVSSSGTEFASVTADRTFGISGHVYICGRDV